MFYSSINLIFLISNVHHAVSHFTYLILFYMISNPLTYAVCLEELGTYYFIQKLYTAIVPLVKIHFPNLNLKPIIEFDNENHFTNQRFCINEPSNNLYQHMYLKAMRGCSNLRYYEQFKVL